MIIMDWAEATGKGSQIETHHIIPKTQLASNNNVRNTSDTIFRQRSICPFNGIKSCEHFYSMINFDFWRDVLHIGCELLLNSS